MQLNGTSQRSLTPGFITHEFDRHDDALGRV
jgi:hypothetical protein